MLLNRIRTTSRPRSALSFSLAFALIAGVFLASPSVAATSTAVVETVSPSVGTTGTVVTITGSGLSATTAVHFGNTAATSFANVSATRVTAVAPAGTGTVDIKVTNANGNVIAKNAFTFKASQVPAISQVSPNTGLPSGFTEVNLVGINFAGATDVKFGTTSAVTFKVNSDSSITAVAPVGISATVVNVYVVNAAGTSSSVATYSYQNVACAPQTYLTTKFAAGVSKLTAAQIAELKVMATQFNTLKCTTVELLRYNETIKKSMTQSHKDYIKLQRTRAINVYNVVAKRLRTLGSTTLVKLVKRPNQISQAKKAYDSNKEYRKIVLLVPGVTVLDAVYPTAGALTGGNTINITGRGLQNIAATGAVKFGAVAATYTINVAKDTLSVVVPPSSVAGTVALTVQPAPNAALLSSTYTYTTTPTTTALSQTSGELAGGNTITITGTNFTGMRNVSAVKFGTVNASSYIVSSATSISAVVPAGSAAGSVQVTVVTPSGVSNAQSYTYVAAPSIASLSSVNVSLNGGNLSITGDELNGATTSSIRFSNGVRTWSPSTIASNNGNTLVMTLGAQSSSYAGLIDITVGTTGGSVTLNDAFRMGTAITAVTKLGGGTAEGPIAGGTSITITGIDFPSPVEAVRIDGVNATSFTRDSATSITAVTPTATETGRVSVRVYSDVDDNEYVELADAFAYIPTVTSVTPDEGPLSGGANVTIVGTGFADSVVVTIGGATATQVSKTATQIVVTPPTRTAGAKDIVITTNGVSVTANNAYTYRAAPVITSLTPDEMDIAGGQIVAISGSNFIVGETTVTFGGSSIAAVTTSSTSITFTAPANQPAGAVTVTVTTIGGSASETFTYIAG